MSIALERPKREGPARKEGESDSASVKEKTIRTGRLTAKNLKKSVPVDISHQCVFGIEPYYQLGGVRTTERNRISIYDPADPLIRDFP